MSTFACVPSALCGPAALHASLPQGALEVSHLPPHARASARELAGARLERAPGRHVRCFRGCQQRLEHLGRSMAALAGSEIRCSWLFTSLVYGVATCAQPGAWATCAAASSAAITWRKHGKQAVKAMQLVCGYAFPAVTIASKAIHKLILTTSCA